VLIKFWKSPSYRDAEYGSADLDHADLAWQRSALSNACLTQLSIMNQRCKLITVAFHISINISIHKWENAHNDRNYSDIFVTYRKAAWLSRAVSTPPVLRLARPRCVQTRENNTRVLQSSSSPERVIYSVAANK